MPPYRSKVNLVVERNMHGSFRIPLGIYIDGYKCNNKSMGRNNEGIVILGLLDQVWTVTIHIQQLSDAYVNRMGQGCYLFYPPRCVLIYFIPLSWYIFFWRVKG